MKDPSLSILGVLLIQFGIPFVVIVFFAVWHMRKLNSIDQSVREILEKLKNN